MSQGARPSNSTGFNGATILKKKQLGRVKIFFAPPGLRFAIDRVRVTVCCPY
jgi:hypothetical protein